MSDGYGYRTHRDYMLFLHPNPMSQSRTLRNCYHQHWGLVAIKKNRNSIGVEIDPVYCEMTMQRLEKETRTLFSSVRLEMAEAKDLM